VQGCHHEHRENAAEELGYLPEGEMQIASRHFALAGQGGCVARDVTRKCFHT
jgi:hypothetical protein